MRAMLQLTVLLALTALACAPKSNNAATATATQPAPPEPAPPEPAAPEPAAPEPAAPEPAPPDAEPTTASELAVPQAERVTPKQLCTHIYAIIGAQAKSMSRDDLVKRVIACIRDMTELQTARGDDEFQRGVACSMRAKNMEDLTICTTPKTDAICQHVVAVVGVSLGDYVAELPPEQYQILLDECAYDMEEKRKSMTPTEYGRHATCMMKSRNVGDIDVCNGFE
jgi:hypothetical protein